MSAPLSRILLVCVACACSSGNTTDRPSAPSNTVPPPPSAGSAGPAISDAVRTAICSAEPCGGPMSSIRVYRDARGTVKKLYRLYGRCSHNAGIYFDPDGTQTEIIPEKPIEPGSEEAKQFQAKHDKQVGGLTEAESISCR
jgi:hypothetical protein